MGSRLKEDPDQIFECFFEVAAPEDDESDPIIIERFPADFDDPGVDQQLPKFCFPCDLSTYNPAGQLFTFVLTNIDNIQRFGFCRHPPGAKTCLCILSYLPWFDIFYKVLNQLAELKHSDQDQTVLKIVKELYKTTIPEPKKLLTISVEDNGKSTEMHLSTPDPTSLPRIPESRNFMEFFSAVNPNNMMILFVSLLYERRVLITSEKLSRLTACVHGAASLLYPLYWQHIYTPVLPAHLIEYCCAPMPFLVGVHSSFMKRVRKLPLDEVVILNVDNNLIEAPFDDLEELPPEAMRDLKRNLKNNSVSTGDGVARSFLKTLVFLIGSYKEGLTVTTMTGGKNKIVFDREKYLQSRTALPFLDRSLSLQHFERFVDCRVDRLNSRLGYPNDVFEQQLEIERQDGGCLSSKNKLQRHLADVKEKGIKVRKNVTEKAKKGANPDAIKAKLKDGFDSVSSLSHQLSQQVKTDEMKASFHKGLSKTKDFGRVGIAGVKTATKHVKKQVKGSKDAEDIDIRNRRTMYGTSDLDISTPYTLAPRSGSVPASPAESPVAMRHKPLDLSKVLALDSKRPMTEVLYTSTSSVKHYNPIDLSPEKTPSVTEEDDDDTEDDSSSGMDLMNDPDLKSVLQKISPEKVSAAPEESQVEPAPIPPPRRHRPRKTGSSPAGTPGGIPPPAHTPRRGSQQGQLIDIGESPSTTKQPHPKKPTRNFPSPINIGGAPSNEAPLIQVAADTQRSLPKSPSDSNLFFELGENSDGSSDDPSSNLDVVKSLKGSNSSPNLIGYNANNAVAIAQHEPGPSQTGNLIDPFSSSGAGNEKQNTQSIDSSQQNQFGDSFVPIVSSSTTQVQTSNASQPVHANPFTDSFVKPPTAANVSMAAANNYNSSSPRKTLLSLATPTPSTVTQTPQRRTSSTTVMQPTHPAYVSHDLLQPTSVQKTMALSTSKTSTPSSTSSSTPDSKAKVDPFADLVSMQFKATSPTWKK